MPDLLGEQCQVPVDSLTGTWRGSGHQSGGATLSMDYPIVMYISQGGGSIEYPSLSCGGSLTELSNSGTSAQFQEYITYGDCLDGGSITVNLVNGKLVGWVGHHCHRRAGAARRLVASQYDAGARLTKLLAAVGKSPR